jgi:GTP-binding protein Era
MAHKAGFVNLIGKPNAGKSTLMNALVGQQLSVVNPKAQTTRHRILGILSTDDYQIVFSDTPGIIAPAYKLQERMMRAVRSALEDADVIVLVDDLKNPVLPGELQLQLPGATPLVVVLNKSDLVSADFVSQREREVNELLKPRAILGMSALTGHNVDLLLKQVIELLPEHPAYFPKDALTDRSLRFIVTEIIRGKLLDNYRKEVPYACEVAIESFKEEPAITRIRAVIFVERESQKVILIGSKGTKMKKVGIEARSDIEQLLGNKVYLELHVKVQEKWRQRDQSLDYFGY